jgi:hypothetical protein
LPAASRAKPGAAWLCSDDHAPTAAPPLGCSICPFALPAPRHNGWQPRAGHFPAVNRFLLRRNC